MTNRPKLSPSDWTAIARYVSGEATPDERAALEAAATADPVFAQLFFESFTGWTVAGRVPLSRNKEVAWASIDRRVTETTSATTDMRSPPTRLLLRHHHRSRWYAWAGALALAVIATGWRIGAWRALGGFSSAATAYTTYVTASGERANITLPDGNMVALSVASRLEVPTDYNAGNHAVRLPTGEALFTISRRGKTPFTVISGSVTARVLGTSFVVRHYATDSVATVAVAKGKVAVGDVVVVQRHMVQVSPSGTLYLRPSDASEFSFATGVLALGAMRLVDAIPELDRWYDADIRLGDPSLAEKQIEGEMKTGSLGDLTELLEWTCNVRVVRDGRVLTLYPKGK